MLPFWSVFYQKFTVNIEYCLMYLQYVVTAAISLARHRRNNKGWSYVYIYIMPKSVHIATYIYYNITLS